MHKITNLTKRSKAWLEGEGMTWVLPAIVFLVAIGSFGLGRLSAIEDARPPVSITHASRAGAAPVINLGGEFVASRNGSAYYFPWCAGAQKIALQNQVWFKDEQSAQRAGYSPAKNCKGLTSPQ